MRLSLLLLLLSTLGMAQNLRSGGQLKPEQAIMDIRHYTIALDIDPSTQSIKGYAEIELILSQSTDKLLFDLWHGLTVKRVSVNGKTISFQHGEDDLIRIAQTLPAGKVRARVDYEGKPGIAARPPWTGGFQWEKDGQGKPWIAVTCQMEGGKIYFPCKDHPSDEPNEGADMILTVPQGLTAAGPGLLIDQSTKKGKTTFHWKTKYTISNYCMVFNVGNYRKVSRPYTTIDGNKVPMYFYVLAEHEDKAAHLLEMMERTCHVLEKYFGEYPWVREKIGLCETPHLGMEHQTLIAYGNQFRYAQAGGQDFDWLLNHEFGHEWWANKVTNRNWAHMWIQEGICSFGDALYIRDMDGEEAYLKRMQATARQTQNRVPVVQGDVVDSDQAYQGDIYGKGAFFMHTLRHVMGDDLFFPTLKKLATDPSYTYDHTVVTDDVEKLFSTAYGKSLKPLFDLYLYTTNKLEISLQQVDTNKYRLQLLNLDMDIPSEVVTDKGTQKVTLNKNPITLESTTLPMVDPNVYYLKKVIVE
jgi:aminopeptidase N